MNRQFEFSIINRRTNKRDTVFCTAASDAVALKAIQDKYAFHFDILETPIANRPAHTVLTEIDATRV